ncbi:MAG: hypothetical protein M0Z28_06220 [Rhodospirillales bacterium]|nr:hypothetical protein [Rhodospirillales bacterium]
MPRPATDDDATVVRRPTAVPPPSRRRRWPAAAGATAALALAALGWWALRPLPAPPSVPAPPTAAPPALVSPAPPPVVPPALPAPAPTAFPIGTADEATIRDHAAATLTVFRFAPDPAIVVLDFPTLHAQGAMLNRVAALIEKAGLPRDRVLTDAELDAAIRASGDSPDTYYFGHDYPAAALVRFFALADAGHVTLNAEEEQLRALARQLGWTRADAVGALISLPQVPQEAVAALDAAARATILHHELSHGLFFTDPAYAEYVRRFWDTTLTAAERDAVRRFLASEGYDTGDEVLTYNEMQAYLLFTGDPRFCRAANLGMTPERRTDLAQAFLRDMPPGWLRDALAQGIATLR